MAILGRAAAFEADAPQSDAAAAGEPVADAIETTGPTDWSVLNWHPGAAPSDDAPVQRWTMPAPAADAVANWSRTEHADGSAAVTVKRPLQAPWDSKIGAEFNLAPHAEGGTDPESSTSAAWASVSTPSFNQGTATIDARLDAAQTLSKASISASNSMALSRQLSLTLQSGYAAAESFAPSTTMMPADAASDSQFYTTEQIARLTILPTQTKVAAGLTMSTADHQWQQTLSAEQQLFAGASVTGSITESAEGLLNTSVVAKFQRRW